MSIKPTPDLSPSANHVFLDFENVHEVDLAVIGGATVSFTLLVGAQKKKLDIALVEKMMEHAASVQLVRLTSSGRNALDFVLYYYVGRASISDPTACFHIVSKDTGFDPLVAHLQSRQIHARRHDDFSTLTFSAAPKIPATLPDDFFARVVANLKNTSKTWPKRKKTLEGKLRNFLGKNATDERVAELTKRMCDGGYAVIDAKGAVTYNV